MKANKILIPCALLAFGVFLVSPLYAAGASAEGSTPPWGNFLLRVMNLCIVIGLIYYLAGAKIKGALLGRGKKVVSDMDDLEQKKKEAIQALADVEKRIANVEEECAKLLLEGKAGAEQIAKTIVEEAEGQAKAILEQANKSAEQAVRAEVALIRAKLADEVMAEVRKNLEANLDQKKHKELIDASVARVSGF